MDERYAEDELVAEEQPGHEDGVLAMVAVATKTTYRVTRTNLIGTGIHVYAAWVPHANHSSLTHFGDACYGRVGTEPLPAEIDALPAMSDERYEAVQAFHARRYGVAYNVIIKAFPEACAGHRDMGEIELGGSHGCFPYEVDRFGTISRIVEV